MRKSNLIPLVFLAFAACGSSLLDPYDAPSAESVKHYRAWCKHEQKYLGDWDPDRSVAESLRTRHNKMFGHHVVLIQTVER